MQIERWLYARIDQLRMRRIFDEVICLYLNYSTKIHALYN